jgi:Fur family ferric uptake transcriptional regulator
MEAKVYTEIRALFTEYLTEKKLRKTEERYAIFKEICAFPGHFDVCMLSDRLEQDNFHVSKATLYNTLDVLVDAGLVVRHQITVQSVQYELRIYADTHLHLVCTRCGAIRESGRSAPPATPPDRCPGSSKQCVESGYEKLESFSFYAGVLLFVHLWPVQ